MSGHVFDHQAESRPPISTRFASVTLIVLALVAAGLWGALRSDVQASGNEADRAKARGPGQIELAGQLDPASALVKAAELGDVELVDELLGSGVDPNARDAAGQHALPAAVAAGQTAIARKLLSAGAKLERTDRGAVTELHLAATRDDEVLIDLLLVAKAAVDARAKDLDNSTALHIASECGHEHTAATLLRAKADIEALDALGFTPLTRATLLGRANVVHLLTRSGVDVRRVDAHQRTALQLAAAVGDEESVQSLLAAGADVGALDESGWTALHYAAAHGRANLVPILTKPMSRALQDQRTSRGATALHLAARRGESACVQALLDAGLDPRARDLDGRSTRDLAAGEPDIEPWTRLGPASPVLASLQPDPALHDSAARPPMICICTRPAQTLHGPLLLLDLAIWEDGATVFAPWSADGSREYVAGVLSAAELASLQRDLDEGGWLDAAAPKLDRAQRDCVELTILRGGKYLRSAWDDVETADQADGLVNRAQFAEWSLGLARVRDVLRAARPQTTQAMSFVLVEGTFRGLSFENGAHAAWMD